jgi:glutamyl/glutaminyl-tRNA synthetase
VLLRLEDLDPTRCTPALADEMCTALAWLGLDWDGVSLQSEGRAAHDAALAQLIDQGDVYPCTCSRAAIREAGRAAADGGFRYPGTCRDRPWDPAILRGGDSRMGGDSRTGGDFAGASLRLRLEPGVIATPDEGGLDLSLDPASALGDPVLRRRDGAIAYHLAVVVDDARQQIHRVVRGRDLAVCTAIHRVLQRALALPTPVYRHHLLLLEERGEKLAKLHGSVSWRTLREHMSPETLCGVLAGAVGLQEGSDPVRPLDLVDSFTWRRVAIEDQIARFSGSGLELRPL